MYGPLLSCAVVRYGAVCGIRPRAHTHTRTHIYMTYICLPSAASRGVAWLQSLRQSLVLSLARSESESSLAFVCLSVCLSVRLCGLLDVQHLQQVRVAGNTLHDAMDTNDVVASLAPSAKTQRANTQMQTQTTQTRQHNQTINYKNIIVVPLCPQCATRKLARTQQLPREVATASPARSWANTVRACMHASMHE